MLKYLMTLIFNKEEGEYYYYLRNEVSELEDFKKQWKEIETIDLIVYDSNRDFSILKNRADILWFGFIQQSYPGNTSIIVPVSKRIEILAELAPFLEVGKEKYVEWYTNLALKDKVYKINIYE